jgi:sorting nexin-7/30
MESLDLDASTKSDETVSRSSSLIANFRMDEDFETETRDLFIRVDDPEKHTSTLEAYITFRVTTKVGLFFYVGCVDLLLGNNQKNV